MKSFWREGAAMPTITARRQRESGNKKGAEIDAEMQATFRGKRVCQTSSLGLQYALSSFGGVRVGLDCSCATFVFFLEFGMILQCCRTNIEMRNLMLRSITVSICAHLNDLNLLVPVPAIMVANCSAHVRERSTR